MTNLSLYELFLVFLIYSFIGWVIEVIYYTINDRKFVNPGFLNSPICPIYGFGALAIIYLLSPYKDNLFVLFIGCVILTSSIELVTGFVLKLLFGQKWWDYSNLPMNFMGYVCLPVSIAWGVVGLIIVFGLGHFVFEFVKLLPNSVTMIAFVVLGSFLLLDFVATLGVLLNLSIGTLSDKSITKKFKVISNNIGKTISDNTMEVMEVGKNHHEDIAEFRGKYLKSFQDRNFIFRRISKAFPNLSRPAARKKKRKLTK